MGEESGDRSQEPEVRKGKVKSKKEKNIPAGFAFLLSDS
jgi:hypothetical protein